MAPPSGLGLTAFLLLAVVTSYTDGNDVTEPVSAICILEPDPATNLSITGNVTFYQTSASERIQIRVQVAGLPELSDGGEDRHGFHIHTYGNIKGGCGAAGGHYNPFGVRHGGRDFLIRHVGDFGNIRQNCDGTIDVQFVDTRARLFGDVNILGRSIVLHAGVDDLGLGGNAASLANGNAGARIACCPIVLTPPESIGF